MRKIKFLLFTFLLCMTGVTRAVETTDKVVISELTVTPGSNEEYYFTVSLQGTDVYYTAYQADLQLPPGLEFVYKSNGELRVSMVKQGIYPYSEEEEENEDGETVKVKSYTHSLSCNIIESNTLRVAVISTSNQIFTATSGNLFKVYVKASPYLKPGDVNIGVKNVKLVTADEIKYLPADYVSTSVKTEATSTLTLKVSAENQYGTCILPFDYELPTDGSLEAYTCDTYNSEMLLLNKVTRMEAYTPYILRSTMGFSSTISGAVDATGYPEEGFVQNGLLVGTVVTKELSEGCYVMQNQGSGTKFYRVGSTPFILAGGKCYVEFLEYVPTAVFSLGGATGIEFVQEEPVRASQTIYNLHGQPVEQMISGHIYIVNGEKIIAK